MKTEFAPSRTPGTRDFTPGRLILLVPYLVVVLVLAVIFARARSVDEVILNTDTSPQPAATHSSAPASGSWIDPVCHMEVRGTVTARVNGRQWAFCSTGCRARFLADPTAYMVQSCPVCRADGRDVPPRDPSSSGIVTSWRGQTFRFCGPDHRDLFFEAPGHYLSHRMAGLPDWLYYVSLAAILFVSFGLFEWAATRWSGKNSPIAGPRIDLLVSPSLRRLLASARVRFLVRLAVVALFVLVIGAGLFGNQLPNKNIAPILTWTIWWGGLVWFVAYFGKLWCTVCPWDAIAEWSEGRSLRKPGRTHLGLGLPWPRSWRNLWPATILFIGLTWIELGFGVTMKPRVTAWLGLLLLALAFASVFIFDRKSFCRYGCLVGRVSGLYALFAPVEMRARSPEVCRSCRTHDCYRGNERGPGCPTFQFPARMDANTYCTLCLECLRTCPHENMTLRLRPWGADLETLRRPRSDEAYLVLVMLSLTILHGLTMTPNWDRIVTATQTFFAVGPITAFSAAMLAVMLIPVVIYAALVGLSWWIGDRRTAYREYFLRYAYTLLPIALFYHLAHNSEHLLLEGHKVLALISDPFGWEWDLFGTLNSEMAPLTDLGSLWLLQVFFVGIGHVYSLWFARRTASAVFPDSATARRSQAPMLLAMILFSWISLWLLKQPMMMRVSSM